jgi:6-phosphogluconolactonase
MCLGLTMWLTGAFASEYIVYIGTYTGGESKGIYAYKFDATLGMLTAIGLVAETSNPSFLAVSPSQKFLYAANEVDKADGHPGGAVTAFAVDPKTGKLTLLNRVSTGGSGPCHVSVDATGKCVMAANYGSGSVAAFQVQPDGSLSQSSAFAKHSGSSVDKERQGGPHAHFIAPSPDNRYALVADLGLDQVLMYRLDPRKGTLEGNGPSFVKVKPGSGPRHLAFHPNGRYAYVINEMTSTITALTYDPSRAAMQEFQTVSTLPSGFNGVNSTAEIAVHPSGKFLYGSNRGHDSIAVFAIDPVKGTLTLVEHESTQGKTPRNFAIDPTGHWLFAANQDSNNIVLFRIDPNTGKLTPSGEKTSVASPVCVTFVAIK